MSNKNIKEATRKVWGVSPAGSTSTQAKPLTKKFFQEAYKFRSEYEMPWLVDVVPFSSFSKKEVLEIGCGAGFDAYNFTKHGAVYTGVDITPENIERTEKHLDLYRLKGELYEADAEKLPFPDESFDVVYSNGVLHHTPNIEKAFSEAFRVLRGGGQFYVILYHKYSVFHWITLFLFDYILRLGFLKMTFSQRLSMIEFTESNMTPLVNVYSRREVKSLLIDSSFDCVDLQVRKLVKEDLPYLPGLRTLWRIIPTSVYEFIGKRFGWYVIAKGVKR